MNTLKSIHVSEETNQAQNLNNYFSMQMLDSSVQSLIKSWKRRQRWLSIFTTTSSSLEDLNRATWRTHLANFLESTWVRVFSISLLILDLIITVLELSSSLVSCDRVRDESRIEVWFHWIGIGILSLFSAKTIALFVGLGSSFFKHPGYVMDGVVAIGALLMESFLERKGGGLLVVVSLWRVIRVAESVFELSDEAIEAQIAGIVCQFEELKEENMRLLETIHEKDKIIEMLTVDLDKCRSGNPFINSRKF
ncbi:uncharacterized protein LOC130732378 [Lotus japonicus]|uniref:uncharacterized protein LOC130732378 n=1 Tax=Lotus japonicus TaxID=34305 RepID=UPI002585B867|nr:uncharacterized protein LOC130732378 [Lotus japonicus]